MKIFQKLLLCIVTFSFVSCDGEFEEADFAINLVYPLAGEECEDANLTRTNVEVPFRWTAQGDFNSFTLFIDDKERTEQAEFDEESEQYEVIVPLDYREVYTWRVLGKQAIDFKSDKRSFSTPITFENINLAPYAVIFEEPITSPEEVLLNWSAEDPDGPSETDELKFDVYLDESNPPTTLRASDIDFTTINIKFLERRKYYAMVVAKDRAGNTSSNIISFDGE